MTTSVKLGTATLILGWVLVAIGHGIGLFVAPPEAMMGDVGRILYVHVPTAWVALSTFLAAFICAIGSLAGSRWGWDAATVATVEVGLLLNGLLLVQGSLWARPTWGVFWTWDPRLTTSAVMALAFGSVLLLRGLVEEPARRRTVTAICTIVAFVNVPIVYMSVKWWRTLHQDFSSPNTVDSYMVHPLRISAFGMLFMATGLAMLRWKAHRQQLALDIRPPELPEAPQQVVLPTEAGGIEA